VKQEYAKMLINNTTYDYKTVIYLNLYFKHNGDIYKNKEKICREVKIFEKQVKLLEKREEETLNRYKLIIL
jgi:hypothetical protein